MTTITTAEVVDLRFPTSELLQGSDAMNPDPDYSAAALGCTPRTPISPATASSSPSDGATTSRPPRCRPWPI
ncbi:MAG: hypothetical protein R2695_13020 [Acidimicrobiales bacterium]